MTRTAPSRIHLFARIAAVTLLAGGIATAAFSQTTPPARNIRIWPMPETVSPEGRAAAMASANTPMPNPLPPMPVIRQLVGGMQDAMGAKLAKRHGVRIEAAVIAGVPVRIIYPKGVNALGKGPVLLNLHGGGGKVDSGSLTETIPMAALTGVPVVAVLYRLAPENPYPARLDDALAVYQALEKDRKASRLAVYGTSAGAVLGAQLLARLTSLGRPMPAALGFFSGTADASKKGDSESWMPMPGGGLELEDSYKVPRTDPVLSPIHGNLSGFPPTLLVSSTRDLALSGTSIFGRALLERGVDAQLVIFDGLPHAFWTYLLDIPETDQANALMANFLKRRLVPSSRPQAR
ncbi:alpha/beta hydrolase [Sphingomonas sp. MG17]|uniref:Alpha/beta hydrolase n=1 Tax=Sphingomonas tagetis TaxID=2949092 RepID=A0A9X2HJD0_9SPHN|nr:alpha/beta hydrolase [Sphingomonas tagetis]MCP3731132.1 alpha/beta hydrolase [Sphingomonas tagetis]